MGNLLQKRGEVKDAAKMYRSAVKLDPTHKASHYNLGGLHRFFELVKTSYCHSSAAVDPAACCLIVSVL